MEDRDLFVYSCIIILPLFMFVPLSFLLKNCKSKSVPKLDEKVFIQKSHSPSGKFENQNRTSIESIFYKSRPRFIKPKSEQVGSASEPETEQA